MSVLEAEGEFPVGILTWVTQSTLLPFSGEPWVMSSSSAPLHCSSHPVLLPPSQVDSDSQASRPIGCQTLVEALANPELIEKGTVLAFFGGISGVTLSPYMGRALRWPAWGSRSSQLVRTPWSCAGSAYQPCVLFQLLVKNLRGEMTLPEIDEHQSLLQDGVLGRRIAWLLSLNGSQVLAAVWGSGGA